MANTFELIFHLPVFADLVFSCYQPLSPWLVLYCPQLSYLTVMKTRTHIYIYTNGSKLTCP